MRRIVCRRFGASICLGAGATGCKNDRGIAESVNPRQRVIRRPDRPPFQARTLEPESPASCKHHWIRAATTMKSIFLALALIATGVHAAEESDNNPCDAVENDVQTLECSTYSRTTAEDLLKDNYASLTERMQTAYGKNATQLADITAKLKTAQQQWLKTRDADCAVEAFPATAGSKAFTIAQNDCVARMSDERSEFLESIGQE